MKKKWKIHLPYKYFTIKFSLRFLSSDHIISSLYLGSNHQVKNNPTKENVRTSLNMNFDEKIFSLLKLETKRNEF